MTSAGEPDGLSKPWNGGKWEVCTKHRRADLSVAFKCFKYSLAHVSAEHEGIRIQISGNDATEIKRIGQYLLCHQHTQNRFIERTSTSNRAV